jgi:hypothetical protein
MADCCVHLLVLQYLTAAEKSARSWAAPVRATGTERKRQAVGPFHYVKSQTCRVTLLKPAL